MNAGIFYPAWEKNQNQPKNNLNQAAVEILNCLRWR